MVSSLVLAIAEEEAQPLESTCVLASPALVRSSTQEGLVVLVASVFRIRLVIFFVVSWKSSLHLAFSGFSNETVLFLPRSTLLKIFLFFVFHDWSMIVVCELVPLKDST